MRGLRFRYGAVALVLISILLFPATTTADSGTRYLVRSGDRLASIAQAYGVSVSSIMQANGLTDPDFIWAGQTLIIPGAAGGSSATAGTSGSSGSVYVVQRGDTLGDIAVAHGVSVSALLKANGLGNPDKLYAGQRLVIPGGATPSSSQSGSSSPTTSAPPASSPSSSGYYAVKSGDTLDKIAARYGTTAAAIARSNNLSSPDVIYTGMQLRLSSSSGNTSTTSPAPQGTGQGTHFVASISQQHCWLYQGSAVLDSWGCSTGRSGAPSVPGTYHVQSKMVRAYGAKWNFWMPYWLGIYWAGSTENGIHGFPADAVTGVRVWTTQIGTPVTYGCILLSDTNAKTLYDMAWIGMPVVITR